MTWTGPNRSHEETSSWNRPTPSNKPPIFRGPVPWIAPSWTAVIRPRNPGDKVLFIKTSTGLRTCQVIRPGGSASSFTASRRAKTTTSRRTASTGPESLAAVNSQACSATSPKSGASAGRTARDRDGARPGSIASGLVSRCCGISRLTPQISRHCLENSDRSVADCLLDVAESVSQ